MNSTDHVLPFTSVSPPVAREGGSPAEIGTRYRADLTQHLSGSLHNAALDAADEIAQRCAQIVELGTSAGIFLSGRLRAFDLLPWFANERGLADHIREFTDEAALNEDAAAEYGIEGRGVFSEHFYEGLREVLEVHRSAGVTAEVVDPSTSPESLWLVAELPLHLRLELHEYVTDLSTGGGRGLPELYCIGIARGITAVRDAAMAQLSFDRTDVASGFEEAVR